MVNARLVTPGQVLQGNRNVISGVIIQPSQAIHLSFMEQLGWAVSLNIKYSHGPVGWRISAVGLETDPDILRTLANDSCILSMVAVVFSEGTMVALGESQLISKLQDIIQVDRERSVYSRQL